MADFDVRGFWELYAKEIRKGLSSQNRREG